MYSDLSEAEKRVLAHGVTPGCPLCEEAERKLEITTGALEWLAEEVNSYRAKQALKKIRALD
jgi:hypothetical protein